LTSPNERKMDVQYCALRPKVRIVAQRISLSAKTRSPVSATDRSTGYPAGLAGWSAEAKEFRAAIQPPGATFDAFFEFAPEETAPAEVA